MPLFFVHIPDLIRIVCNASSFTARVLALCILILSIAPLGSIYVLFMSLFGIWDLDYIEISTTEPVTLSQALKNQPNNMTAEELFQAVFMGKHQGGFVLAYLPIKEQSLHHLRFVLPWMFSFVFGVVFPAVLSIWSFLRHRRFNYRRQRKQKSNFKRACKVVKGYTKVLRESDKVVTTADPYGTTIQSASSCTTRRERKEAITDAPVADHDNSHTTICTNTLDDDNDDDESTRTTTHKWKLPLPGFTNDCNTRILMDATCAICLAAYRVDESIAWSNNPACIHAFHARCITSWLERNMDLQCPCCRQVFAVVDVRRNDPSAEKNRWRLVDASR
jgi:hypothetical protein